MFKKLTLVVAAGAGYVLGAKAGKERYRQIESKFREISGMPVVQDATATVKETASDAVDTAKAAVSEKAAVVADKAKEVKGSGKGHQDVVVDLPTSSGATTGAAGSTTTRDAKPVTAPPASPMAGAAASATAPDITRP